MGLLTLFKDSTEERTAKDNFDVSLGQLNEIEKAKNKEIKKLIVEYKKEYNKYFDYLTAQYDRIWDMFGKVQKEVDGWKRHTGCHEILEKYIIKDKGYYQFFCALAYDKDNVSKEFHVTVSPIETLNIDKVVEENISATKRKVGRYLYDLTRNRIRIYCNFDSYSSKWKDLPMDYIFNYDFEKAFQQIFLALVQDDLEAFNSQFREIAV